jgi:hypothetical protein
MKKISKYWTLIEENGVPAALFNHRTHRLIYNWVRRPDWSGLPVNSFIELGTDSFYNKLEKITQ